MFRSAALFHSGLRRRHALAVAVAATLVVAPDAALAQTTTDPTAPVTSVTTSTTAPTGLKATVASGTVTLDWDDYPSDKLSYYAVRRGTQPNPSTGTWTRLAPNYTTSTATDKPATGTYYYYVTAIDTSKVVSPRSTVVMVNTATPTATPTPAPVVGGTETAPAPTPTPVATDPIIAAAGDIACDPASSSYNGGSGTASSCRQKATSDLVYNRGFAKVLTLGDNQYESGTLSAFNKSYAPTWGRFKSITSPAVGNHEYRVSGAAGYFDYFNGSGVSTGRAGSRGKGYYSYNVGDWHLVALNSNCSYVSCAAGSAQESWLKADLAANTAKCTLAYWHHPRFSSGSHGNNTSVAPLYNALYAANADVVLTSHDHSYERFAPQNASGAADSARGIRQFVVGTGGKSAYSFGTPKSNSQVRNSGTFGVLEMTLRPTSYDWKFRPEAGRSFTDAGTTSCH